MNVKPILIACLLVSLAGNAYLGLNCFQERQVIEHYKNVIAAGEQNKDIINFNGLVIEKVLRADGEVSFDDRLLLENSVRNTKDAELLAQWNKFTGSKNEVEAQQEMKNLLGLLARKMEGRN